MEWRLLVPSALVFLGLFLIISTMWCWYLLSLCHVPAGDTLHSSFLTCLPGFYLGASWTVLCLLITHLLLVYVPVYEELFLKKQSVKRHRGVFRSEFI